MQTKRSLIDEATVIVTLANELGFTADYTPDTYIKFLNEQSLRKGIPPEAIESLADERAPRTNGVVIKIDSIKGRHANKSKQLREFACENGFKVASLIGDYNILFKRFWTTGIIILLIRT
jgi:hypothetical protein